MPIEVAPSLADALTLAGAVVIAPLITVFVQMAKIQLPLIGQRGWEQALALWTSAAVVIAASVDRHLTAGATSPNDVFVSIVAWLAIAKLATGVYDEATKKPGSLLGPST
jgi:hypothetical protein